MRAVSDHDQLNPFCHPFYPDVTHVRKDARPSPALPYWNRWKAGRSLGMRLLSYLISIAAYSYLQTLSSNKHSDNLFRSEGSPCACAFSELKG